jgi:hypothetical protein
MGTNVHIPPFVVGGSSVAKLGAATGMGASGRR